MVGREVLLRVEKAGADPGRPAAHASKDVSAEDDRGLPAVNDASSRCARARSSASAGIDANGQTELIEAIMGLRAPTAGTIAVAGKDVTHCGPRATLDAGVSHIAEDRHRRGLVLEFDLAENLCLREYKPPALSTRGFLSPSKMVARARKLLKEFDVRGGDPETRAGSLSGGNQQKVVIARELDRRSAGDRRRPAHARPGRRRDRVRPPAPRRGARRGARASCSCRWSSRRSAR